MWLRFASSRLSPPEPSESCSTAPVVRPSDEALRAFYDRVKAAYVESDTEEEFGAMTHAILLETMKEQKL